MQITFNNGLINEIKNTDIFEALGHSKNYFFSDIATKALGFISIPIFTRLFSQEDYGIVAVFTSYVGIMTIILSLSSYTAVSRYYYEKTDDFDEFLGTNFIFTGLIFSIAILLYILFYQQIKNLIKLPGLLPTYLLFLCSFSIINSIYMQILIPQKKSKEYAIINILNGYIGFVIAVLLVYLLKENRYLGKIWANLLIGFVFSIYFLVNLSKYFKLSFKIKYIKYIVSYSFPLIPYFLSGIILAQFDRIMIYNIIDAKSTGLYSLGYNIGMSLLIIIGAMQKARAPFIYQYLDNKKYDSLDSLMVKTFSIVLICAFGLILFAKEIIIVLADKKFHEGLSVIPFVVTGYIFYEMSSIVGMFIRYTKKTIFQSITVLFAGALNIILNKIFIPKYGYIAGAYTTTISYFVMFLLTFIVVKYFLKKRVTPPLWLLWKPTLIMFGFIAFTYFLNTLGLNAILFIFIKLMLLVLFGIIVFYKEIGKLIHLIV